MSWSRLIFSLVEYSSQLFCSNQRYGIQCIDSSRKSSKWFKDSISIFHSKISSRWSHHEKCSFLFDWQFIVFFYRSSCSFFQESLDTCSSHLWTIDSKTSHQSNWHVLFFFFFFFFWPTITKRLMFSIRLKNCTTNACRSVSMGHIWSVLCEITTDNVYVHVHSRVRLCLFWPSSYGVCE